MAAAGRRLVQFDDQLYEQYGGFRSVALQDNLPARGCASTHRGGPFHAAMIEAQNLTSRRAAMGEPWASFAFLVVPLEGAHSVHHYGSTMALSRGDIFVMDSHAPCELVVPGRARSVVISMPRHEILRIAGQPENIFGRKVTCNQGLPRLLSSMLHSSLDDSHHYDARESRLVQQTIIAMLDHELFGRSDEGKPATARETELLSQIRVWLINNFHRQHIGVDDIARQFNMSRSSLYRLFDELGVPPARWIMRQRLLKARDSLANSRHHRRTVAAISFEAGFNDPAHFSRLFRQTFGVTPGEFQKSRLVAERDNSPASNGASLEGRFP